MKNFIAQKYQNMPRTPMGEASENAKKFDDVIDLSLGDPDLHTPKVIIDAAVNDVYTGHTRYTDSLGDEELRQEIANFYQEEYGLIYDTESIMTVVGGCHGMCLLLEAILNPGDEVIVHAPYFTPYPMQIDIAGGVCVEVETYETDGFELQAEQLLAKISPKTKALILNYPNNPTGATISRENLAKIVQIVIEHDLLVIADDIYTSFSYDEKYTPIATFPGMKERTIMIGSFSKDYMMSGWRVGYVVAHPLYFNVMREINEGVCFTAPSISQRAALSALKNRHKLTPHILAVYKERLDYAYQRINRISGLRVARPKGTFYLFVNCEGTGIDSTTFCQRVLNEAHVLILPGASFGAAGEGFVRIACTVPIEQLKEAFDRIEAMELFQN